ncbi:hypothetical protein EYR41_006122 [Orbilia oligospora]|uniref:Uncharacterized protein n=1 Tax=Orbilia oligospora TaxID=2813651 RepID=A0A8H2E469_ORBOL|nr:hypothetical protein EYR41_006122 [Orbilia oligospora]
MLQRDHICSRSSFGTISRYTGLEAGLGDRTTWPGEFKLYDTQFSCRLLLWLLDEAIVTYFIASLISTAHESVAIHEVMTDRCLMACPAS